VLGAQAVATATNASRFSSKLDEGFLEGICGKRKKEENEMKITTNVKSGADPIRPSAVDYAV